MSYVVFLLKTKNNITKKLALWPADTKGTYHQFTSHPTSDFPVPPNQYKPPNQDRVIQLNLYEKKTTPDQ